MKISDRVYYLGLVFFLLISFGIIALARLDSSVQEAEQKQEAALEILENASGLIILTNDYLTHPTERVINQWNVGYEKLVTNIDGYSNTFGEHAITLTEQNARRSLQNLFLQNFQRTLLIDAKIASIENSEDTQDELASLQLRRKQSASQLNSNLAEYQTKISIAVRDSENDAERSREISAILSYSLLTICFLFFAITLFLIQRVIIQRITLLSGMFESLNLKTLDLAVNTEVVKGKDEFSHLGQAFVSLVDKLRETNRSINETVAKQTKEISEAYERTTDQQKAIINVLDDVQEEKRESERLANELQKFELAVKNVTDMIVITDSKGVSLYANPAAEKITGFSQKEIIGKQCGSPSLWGGLMDKEFYENLWHTVTKEKKIFSAKFKNKRKNGEEFFAQTSISPIVQKDGSVPFMVLAAQDITQEEAVDRAKTEFVSLASHQLRTPLSAINWYTELLVTEDAGKLNEEQKEYLKEIYTGNQRMVELVNALLNVSRLELGTFAVEPTSLDLATVAHDVVKELKVDIEKRNLSVEFKKPKKAAKIKSDSKLLHIVIMNLMTNAIKYTPAKGSIVVSITSDTYKKPGQKKEIAGYTMAVKDNGMGIPKTQQKLIFTKLFRADNVKKTDAVGTGLGLYMVKKIVEVLDGVIWFKSSTSGTTFSVFVPTHGSFKEKSGKSLELVSSALETKSAE